MESLKRERADEEKLTALLDFYELRALKDRVKKSNAAPSLFDTPEESAVAPASTGRKKEVKNDRVL